jgi:peptidoglycan/LPS O-acetylase OafA/YrhL
MSTADNGPARGDLPQISGHQPALDGLRVIAAFAVLILHVSGQTGFEFTGAPSSWLVSRGDVGVPIFFVLSGLLLYRPWAKAALTGTGYPAASIYLWRRALRILPAYWAVVIAAIALLNRPHAGSVGTWLEYLLLIQNYVPHHWWPGTGAPGLAQMWSLVVEASFYLLLPVLAALLTAWARSGADDIGQRARRLLVGIGAFGSVSYVTAILSYFPTASPSLGPTLPRLTTWFAAGMAITVVATWAHLEHHPDGAIGPVAAFCRAIAGSVYACWAIAAAAFLIACTPVAGPEDLAYPTLWNVLVKAALYTVVAAAVVAPVAFQPARDTLPARLLGNRVMSYLGKISYGIFLWQFVVIYLFFEVTGEPDAFHGGYYAWPAVLGILIVVATVTTALSAASYRFLEGPAQRLYALYRPRPHRAGRHVKESRPTVVTTLQSVMPRD